MPPKLLSDDGKHVVIRPLAYCKESDIEAFALMKEYPIIPCNLCGSQDGLQRQVVKEMLQDWDKRFPGRIETMFQAMQNIVPSHMIDKTLFDFAAVSHHQPVVEGDTAFDKVAVPAVPVGYVAEDDDQADHTALQPHVQTLELV